MMNYLKMRLISLLAVPAVATYALVKGTPDSMMEYLTIFAVIVVMLSGMLMISLSDIENLKKYKKLRILWLSGIKTVVNIYAVIVVLYLAIYTEGMIIPLISSIAIYIVSLFLTTICIAFYIKRIYNNVVRNTK